MDALREVHSEPFHRFDDELLSAMHKPTLVGVFDPQDQFSAEFPGQEVTIKGCTKAADMLWAGRTGGVAKDWFQGN